MPQPKDVLLDDLRARISQGRAVAVVGAGVAIAASSGSTIASWKGLLEDGIERCAQVVPGLPAEWKATVQKELGSGDIDDLLSAAQKVEAKLKRVGEYGRWLTDTVGTLQVRDAAVIDAIRDLHIPIMTTNYDGLIETRTGTSPVTWREPAKYDRVIQGDREGILHLHGFYEDPASVVLGISSYSAVMSDAYAQSMLQAVRSLHSFLFIGYGQGLVDPNFSALFAWARTVFSDSTYRLYRLVRAEDVQACQADHDSRDRVFVLPYGTAFSDLPGFLSSLRHDISTGDAEVKASISRVTAVSSHSPSRPSTAHLDDYLSAIKKAHGHIRFVELPSYEDIPDIEIDKLYVEPMVSRDHILPDRDEAEWPECASLGTLLATQHPGRLRHSG